MILADVEEKFDEIEMLYPSSGKGVAVALRAYFDASAREQSDIYCLAGVCFGLQGAKKAAAKWRALHGERSFHMTDLNAKEQAYKGITEDEKHDLIAGSIEIIKRYAAFTIVTTLQPSKVKPHLPRQDIAKGKFNKHMVLAFRTPYSLCCNLAMNRLSLRADDRSIHYAFELGDDGQQATRKYIEYIASKKHLRHTHKLASLSYHNKDSEMLLGASDLVAWEFGKHFQLQRDGKPVRKSFAALLGVNDSDGSLSLDHTQEWEREKILFQHMGEDFFETYMNSLKQLLETNDMSVWKDILQRSGLFQNQSPF